MIEITISKHSYNGDGVNTTFPVDFRYDDKSHVKVWVENLLKVEGTHYTLTQAGLDDGGTLTFIGGFIPPAGTENVVVERVSPQKQLIEFPPESPFFPQTVEKRIADPLRMSIQELLTKFGVAVAGRLVQWDDRAQNLEPSDIVVEDLVADFNQLIADLIAQANAILAQQIALYDTFDDRYLGAHAEPLPVLDHDGNPLIIGAQLFDTTANAEKTWNGTEWVDNVSGAILEEKDADEARTGLTTAPIDGEVVATLQAGKTYDFEFIAFVSVAVEVGAGINFAIRGTAGIDSLKGSYRVLDDVLVATGVLTAFDVVVTAALDSAVAISTVNIRGTIKTTSLGTFGFGWSPSNAANTTTLLEGSSLKVTSGEGVQGPSGPPGPGMVAFAQSVAVGATSATITHNMNDSTVHLVNISTDWFHGSWIKVGQDADNIMIEWANENPNDPGTLEAIISQSELSGPGGIIGPPGPAGPEGPAGPPGITGAIILPYQVENLTTGLDIGDGTAANARLIFVAPAALTINKISIVSQGTPVGIDNTNPLVIGVWHDAALMVSKTYNTGTPFPANLTASDLGALANNSFAAGEGLRFDVVGGTTANPPSFILQVEYTYD